MAGRMTKTLRHKKAGTQQPRNLPHFASRLFGAPLLIDERKLDAIIPIFERKLNGEPIEQNLSDDDYRESGGLSIDVANGIAVIPVIGTLVRRSSWLDAWSGLMSYSQIAENLETALSDARVKGILLQIDSCGGEAPGCFELCDLIYNARSQKPIWAIGDVDAMSAAYAILSSAERCYCAPRGHTGSIGVISVHLERSRQNEMMGLTYTVFRAGELKGEFNPFEQLTATAAQKQLASMERTRNVFVQTVSRNRATVSVQSALDTEGQWYDPEDAQELGLIDGIATFDDVFSQLAASLGAPPSQIQPPAQPEAPIEPEEIEPSETGAIDAATETGLTGDLTSEDDMTVQNQGGNGGNPPAAGTGTAPQPNTGAPNAGTAPQNTGTVVDFTQPEARAVEIAGLCKMSGHAGLAADFIMSNMSVPEVRQKLTDMNAERNGSELTNAQPGRSGGAAGGGGPLTLGSFVQSRPSDEAIASWQPHLRAAQRANPKFAAQLPQPATIGNGR